MDETFVLHEREVIAVHSSKVFEEPQELRDRNDVDDHQYEKQYASQLIEVVGYGLEDAL